LLQKLEDLSSCRWEESLQKLRMKNEAYLSMKKNNARRGKIAALSNWVLP
jgi:hypothetical protein